MGIRFLVSTVILFFVGVSALAAPEAAEEKKNEGEVVCTHQEDQRKLWIVNEGGGCKVHYLKGGNISVIGSQKSGTDFCERLIEKVKTKLVAPPPGPNFECKLSNENK